MKIKWILFIIYSCLLLSLSTSSFASCTFRENTGYMTATKSFTMPISGIISVPPDTPVGKEIYRQKINLTNQSKVYVVCTSGGTYYTSYNFLTTPIAPPTYSNVVYNTNILGIGIKFSTSEYTGGDFPITFMPPGCSSLSTSCGWSGGFDASSWFSLIKTADTITPGTLLASSLPSVVYSFGQSNNMVDIYKISLSGSLQITSPTCNITPASQSMTVNMGNYKIDTFSGKGATTEWKNASIQLVNCGQFFGNSQGGNDMATFNGTAVTFNSLNNNFLSVTLSPRNGTASTTDAANGIMNIDDGTLSATGVGIQLSSSEGTSDLINLTTGITQTLPKNGTRNITIPLYARYIQTENSVTAGKANGRLEYIITYQ